MGIEIFKKHIKEKRAIKVSYRAKSSSLDDIAKFSRIAQMSKASAIDLPYGKQFFEVAKRHTKLPIFVSSIHPFEILGAVKYGADAIEIGNHNDYYSKAQAYDSNQLYDIVLETLGLINDYDVFVSVTIPGYILIEDQIQLAKKLQLLGVDMIHIEGVSVSNRMYLKDDKSTMANITKISENISIPLMASVVSSNMTSLAFNYGVNAVDFDCISLDSEIALNNDILSMASSVFHRNSINNEIVRTARELALN